MSWTVLFHSAFNEREYSELPEDVQDELLAHLKLVAQFGPALGRPTCDTLKGSKHGNMKELRFDAADGVWRFAFAFDPERQAIVLVGGDKAGVSQRKFYNALIAKADSRYDQHLAWLKNHGGHSNVKDFRRET